MTERLIQHDNSEDEGFYFFDQAAWHVGSYSAIRDGTHTPALEVQSLGHWITREVP